MAHRKAGGTARNLRDSQPKFLGVKIADGEQAKAGAIIVRQRGTRVMPGEHIGMGKDHTLFALKAGTVKFGTRRKIRFDGTKVTRKTVKIV